VGWGREKYIASARNQTSDHPGCTLITVIKCHMSVKFDILASTKLIEILDK